MGWQLGSETGVMWCMGGGGCGGSIATEMLWNLSALYGFTLG